MKNMLAASIGLLWIVLLTSLVFSQDMLFEASNYYAGRGPVDVICADLDGDGDLDLAVVNSVVNYNDKSVAILFNDGAGGFTYDESADRYQMSCPNSISSADFDKDGDIDLAIGDEDQCWADGSGNITILNNDGNGNFTYAAFLTVLGGPRIGHCTDLNGDGYPDLMVALSFQDSVAIMLNNMNGGFDPSVNYAAGNMPRNLCPADINGDDCIDIAVSNSESGDITILVNQCDASFVHDSTYSVGNRPHGIMAGDFDRDGDYDLATCCTASNTIAINFNLGDGTFTVGVDYPISAHPIDLSCVDINMDGYSDLAIACVGSNSPGGPADSVAILINDGCGGFYVACNYGVGDSPYSICSADLDGDCDNDLAVANYHHPSPNDNPSISILKNMVNFGCTAYVALDINPGSCPNPLNIRSSGEDWLWVGGEGEGEEQEANATATALGKVNSSRQKKAVLPAAILGKVKFDVNLIEPESVTLNGVPVLRWNYEDVATPFDNEAEDCICNEYGPDGFTDLTLKFFRDAIIASVGEVYDGQVIPLTISGQLVDGRPFEGIDCVVILAAEENPVASTGNYPNPFNPTTTISFALDYASNVRLDVFNIMGQKVTTLINGYHEAGEHSVIWDGRDQSGAAVASGIYLYRIEAEGYTQTRKMILLK